MQDSYDPLAYEEPQLRDGPESIYKSPRAPHQRPDMQETTCRGHTIQLWLVKHGRQFTIDLSSLSLSYVDYICVKRGSTPVIFTECVCLLFIVAVSDNTQNVIPWYIEFGNTSQTSNVYTAIYRLSGFNLAEIGGNNSYFAYFSVDNNFPILVTQSQATGGPMLINNYPQFTFNFSNINTCKLGSEIYDPASQSADQLYQITVVEIGNYTYGCSTYPTFICPAGLVREQSTQAALSLAKNRPDLFQVNNARAVRLSVAPTGSTNVWLAVILTLGALGLVIFFAIMFAKLKK